MARQPRGRALPPQAVRTCPLCRTTTHYITPSPIWPASQEEKDVIVDGWVGLTGACLGRLPGLPAWLACCGGLPGWEACAPSPSPA
jgi:hypothetical protein